MGLHDVNTTLCRTSADSTSAVPIRWPETLMTCKEAAKIKTNDAISGRVVDRGTHIIYAAGDPIVTVCVTASTIPREVIPLPQSVFYLSLWQLSAFLACRWEHLEHRKVCFLVTLLITKNTTDGGWPWLLDAQKPFALANNFIPLSARMQQ